MTIDITSLITLTLLNNGLPGDQTAFKTPHNNFITVINNILNGAQAFDKQLLTAQTEVTISSDAMTATQSVHTVAAQTGTADDLSTINGINDGQYIIIRAKATHTITVKHAVGNIQLNGGADYALSSNKALILFRMGSVMTDLAPTVSPSASAPGTNILPNWDFEDWGTGSTTALTTRGWTLTGTGATLAREGTIIKQGNYSAKVTRVGNDCRLYRDLFGDEFGGVYVKGRTFTFGAWVYATVASRVRLRFDDGVTVTNSSYHTGGSGWEFLTVSKTLSASATKCEVSLEVITGDTSGYIDSAVLMEVSSMTGNAQPSPLANSMPKRWSVIIAESFPIVVTGNAFLLSAATGPLGAMNFFQSTAAATDEWTISTGWLAQGSYTLRMLTYNNTNCGKIDVYVDNELWGNADLYGASAVYNVPKTVTGTVKFNGMHRITIKVNGKNASSTDYYIIIASMAMYQSTD